MEFPVVCIEWITLPGSTVFEIFENNSRKIGIPVAVAGRHRPSRPIPAFPRFLRRHSNICDGSEASLYVCLDSRPRRVYEQNGEEVPDSETSFNYLVAKYVSMTLETNHFVHDIDKVYVQNFLSGFVQ